MAPRGNPLCPMASPLPPMAPRARAPAGRPRRAWMLLFPRRCFKLFWNRFLRKKKVMQQSRTRDAHGAGDTSNACFALCFLNKRELAGYMIKLQGRQCALGGVIWEGQREKSDPGGVCAHLEGTICLQFYHRYSVQAKAATRAVAQAQFTLQSKRHPCSHVSQRHSPWPHWYHPTPVKHPHKGNSLGKHQLFHLCYKN